MMVMILSTVATHASAEALTGKTLNDELAYRVRFSRAEDVTLLLRKGADANYVNSSGMPMVSVAAARKDEDALNVLKVLVEGGADVNQGGLNNQYPLVIAVRDGNPNMVKYLVFEKNANLNVRDLNGNTPIDIAEYNANDAIIDIIKELKERQQEQLAILRSPERRNALMKEWAQMECELYYLQHYFEVRLDKHDSEYIKEELNKYAPRIKEIGTDLQTNFAMKAAEFQGFIKTMIHNKLSREFAKMPSNRVRRKAGFGTAEDMKKRCDVVVGTFAAKLPK
jgi:ankyrin repeat protein